ncbi:MAG: hypothetical protein ACYTFZ_01445 [Planctomycetota bacterium]|jgi:polysaccharide pyruvyl transferase WcaK-like protein
MYDYDYKTVRGIIGGAALCLTMKHHPIVFAVANGTPVVAVALDDYYYHKNSGALALCGLDAYALDREAFFGPRAEATITDALANTDQIREAMRVWTAGCKDRDGEAIRRFLEDSGRQ